MAARHFAHTRPGSPPAEWEPLEDHLAEVAELARKFTAVFGASDWGELSGRLHDLGKYSDEFQSYLNRAGEPDASEEGTGHQGRVDHSTFGAQYAARSVGGGAGQLLAFVIAGHHAGLANADTDEAMESESTLRSRLLRKVPPVDSRYLPAVSRPTLPFTATPDDGFKVGFFTRMLFSALVDADRIATERFCNPVAAAARSRVRPDIREMNSQVAEYLRALTAAAPSSRVNDVRAEVVTHCERASALEPGFFSLAVPTGGGKTLSALRFALEHAERHALRRVLMAVPFTSIIEQTADVYRNALGELAGDALLEHHSTLSPTRRTREHEQAAENWDVPLIVTTNVQLFDSLFASATTPCRKLHRLARTVIVLDEAQTIPVDLLAPTLAALRELVAHYGCSVVLCTATQPALLHKPNFDIGLRDVRPIVPDAGALHRALRRVRVEHLGILDDDALTSRISRHRTALCIVNTRAHAAELYRRLKANSADVMHLSTLMCAAHRRRVLEQIRDCLKHDRPCVVVSTQLVEAGVDLDFPVVYRAPAGWDSVAQAAGRCNREGRLATGEVYTFDTVREPPPGLLRQAAAVARELRGDFADDFLAPEAIDAFFRQLYWSQSTRWDEHEVMAAFPKQVDGMLRLNFRDASSRYQTIRSEQRAVLVPHDDTSRQLVEHLLSGHADWAIVRACQPYLVSVYPWQLEPLKSSGALLEHDSGLHVLLYAAAYDPEVGLLVNEGTADACQLIC